MDVHDALGLGKDAPLYGNVNTDSLEVFVPTTKQFVTLRVPYPLGFFPRSAIGRVDDPKAGWKGKGLWSDYSSYAAWHIEGGKGGRRRPSSSRFARIRSPSSRRPEGDRDAKKLEAS